jgi:hypothetical protein
VASIAVSSGYVSTAHLIPEDLNLHNLYFYGIEAINNRLNIQGGPKVGIQYIVYNIVLLYNYFWPTLYITVQVQETHVFNSLTHFQKLFRHSILSYSILHGVESFLRS